MKKILLCLLLNSFSILAFGQIDFDKVAILFPNDTDNQPIRLIIALPENGFSTIGLWMRDADPNQRDKSFEAHFKRHEIIDIVDSSAAHFFVKGINRSNAAAYEFRISDNKGQSMGGWQPIQGFASSDVQIRDLPKGMGYLGGHKTTWNNYLLVEIRKKGTDKIVASNVMYWRQIKPVLLNIYTTDELNAFFSLMKLSYPLFLDSVEKKGWAAKYAPNEIDSSTFLPKKLILEPGEESVIFSLNATTFPVGGLEFKVLKDGEVFMDWQANENYNNYIWLKNLKYGEYKLLMRFVIQRHNITEYPFKIKPKWYQTGRFQAISGALSFLMLLILLPLFIFWQQKKKLKKQQIQNEKIAQELKAIRSQLNPHFVFNALSSIQSLMNKNDLTSANYYLTEFSTLLRESLLRNDKESVPLSIELKTLETYIKLERLRFPFAYSIDVDKLLDAHAIEIPYLLLQPLVENAIKHGVSNLYEKGVLTIRIYPKSNDLIVEIKDNGKGFDTNAETKGFGLKLTKERVRLLSESNRQQAVKLLLESDIEKGTTAYLVFKNWL